MTGAEVETIRETLETEGAIGWSARAAALDALESLAAERDRLALENERLRRIKDAAQELLEQSPGRRSATQMLTAMANLRAALREEPEGA